MVRFVCSALAALLFASAAASADALKSADMCITDRLKTYATNSCEPADTLISAAQAACYDSIQDAVKENSIQKNEPLHESAKVMDLTLQKLQGRYRQAVIEFRIFAKRDCKG